jgi:hypothetical protein
MVEQPDHTERHLIPVPPHDANGLRQAQTTDPATCQLIPLTHTCDLLDSPRDYNSTQTCVLEANLTSVDRAESSSATIKPRISCANHDFSLRTTFRHRRTPWHHCRHVLT